MQWALVLGCWTLAARGQIPVLGRRSGWTARSWGAGTARGPQLSWAWQSWRGCGGRLGRLSARACLPAGRGVAAVMTGEEGRCLADRERELWKPGQMSGLGLGSVRGPGVLRVGMLPSGGGVNHRRGRNDC